MVVLVVLRVEVLPVVLGVVVLLPVVVVLEVAAALLLKVNGATRTILFVDGRYRMASPALTYISTLSPFSALAKKADCCLALLASDTLAIVGVSSLGSWIRAPTCLSRSSVCFWTATCGLELSWPTCFLRLFRSEDSVQAHNAKPMTAKTRTTSNMVRPKFLDLPVPVAALIGAAGS